MYMRVPERVQCKIAVLTFKVLHESAPRYLQDLLSLSLTCPVGELYGQQVAYQLPSRAAHQAVSTVGSRAFPVATAQVWNGLPEAVVSSSSLQTFRRQLNTHLVQLSSTLA